MLRTRPATQLKERESSPIPDFFRGPLILNQVPRQRTSDAEFALLDLAPIVLLYYSVLSLDRWGSSCTEFPHLLAELS